VREVGIYPFGFESVFLFLHYLNEK